jgi:DNA-binding transcriptional MerR regulator
MRASRVVLSDDEIASRLRSEGLTGDKIKARLDVRRAAQEAAQQAYNANRTLSANDARVKAEGAAHFAMIAREREEAERAAKADGGNKTDHETETMTSYGQRSYQSSSGKALGWKDMPLPHLKAAAAKSGNSEMQAYAAWREKSE